MGWGTDGNRCSKKICQLSATLSTNSEKEHFHFYYEMLHFPSFIILNRNGNVSFRKKKRELDPTTTFTLQQVEQILVCWTNLFLIIKKEQAISFHVQVLSEQLVHRVYTEMDFWTIQQQRAKKTHHTSTSNTICTFLFFLHATNSSLFFVLSPATWYLQRQPPCNNKLFFIPKI